MQTITVCGSMRFADEMKKIAFVLESLHGYNVLQCTYNVENSETTPAMLENLARAHFQKIDMSDAVYIADINGYIGEQVKKEIAYAKSKRKKVIYHSQEPVLL